MNVMFAGAGLLLFFLFLDLAVVFLTRPRGVAATDEEGEFGAEDPAVVAFLMEACRVNHVVASAALVDTAAAGQAELETVYGDQTLVRSRGSNAKGQARSAMYVAAAVARLDDDGEGIPAEVVHKEVLASSTFRGMVEREALARGLTRLRFPKGYRIFVTAGFACALSLIAAGASSSDPSSNGESLTTAVFLLAMGLLVVRCLTPSFWAKRSRPYTPTASGYDAMISWAAVAHHIRASHEFEVVPPAGVIVWGRRFAYAVALGLAGDTLRGLATPDDDIIWTGHTGLWRKVKVLPARKNDGRSPVGAFLLNVPIAVVPSLLIYGLYELIVANGTFDGSIDGVIDGLFANQDSDAFGASVGLLSIAGLLGPFVLRSVVVAAIAMVDLVRRKTAVGVVLRHEVMPGEVNYSARTVIDTDNASSSVTRTFRHNHTDMPEGFRVEFVFTPFYRNIRRWRLLPSDDVTPSKRRRTISVGR